LDSSIRAFRCRQGGSVGLRASDAGHFRFASWVSCRSRRGNNDLPVVKRLGAISVRAPMSDLVGDRVQTVVFMRYGRKESKRRVLIDTLKLKLRSPWVCVFRLALCRHGVAQHNVFDDRTGKRPNLQDPYFFDPPLTARGKVGALHAGEALRVWWKTTQDVDEVPQLVVTSPLTRCLQTAVLAMGIPDGYEEDVLPIVCVEHVREAHGVHYPDQRRSKSLLQVSPVLRAAAAMMIVSFVPLRTVRALCPISSQFSPQFFVAQISSTGPWFRSTRP
jgi:Histidine phosphatase superfamily (branch 1)